MLKRIEIKIGGLGGQGVVYAADLIGLAASQVYHAVTVSASYGAETRGTVTTAEVVISDQDIDYPHVELPDCLVTMHQKAYDALHDKIASAGCLIIDNYLVKDVPPGNNRYLIPATQLARDKLSDAGLANLILIGSLVNITKLFAPEVVLNVYKSRFQKKRGPLIQSGLKALQLGLDYTI